MYKNVDADKKKRYKSMFLSAGLAVFLTGVSEPIEFMFMFIAPVLYGIHSVITGISFALADIINLRIHAFGAIELGTRIPMMISAGIGMDLINFVITGVVLFFVNFGIFNFAIKKFNIATPGRNGNYIDDESEEGSKSGKAIDDTQIANIIKLLGGRENIVEVDACMTRLRVTVKDTSVVGTQEEWKQNGVLGLIIKDNGVQAIYGPKADTIKSNVQDALGV